MATTTISSQSLEPTLKDNDIVFLDFWADWCGPCKQFAPIYEKVSEAHPDIVFGKVDTEAEQELSAMAGISAIPTLMIFRDGINVFQNAGAIPQSALEDLIRQVRDLDMDDIRRQIAEEKAKNN